MNITKEEKVQVSKTIINNTKIDIFYWTINGVATIIAFIELTANIITMIIVRMLNETLSASIAGKKLTFISFNFKGFFCDL